MPALLADPYTWALVGIVAVVALVAGLLRHEPWWAIVLTAMGASALFIGLSWAGRIGDEAFGAAALASGGFAIWATATQLARRRKSRIGQADS